MSFIQFPMNRALFELDIFFLSTLKETGIQNILCSFEMCCLPECVIQSDPVHLFKNFPFNPTKLAGYMIRGFKFWQKRRQFCAVISKFSPYSWTFIIPKIAINLFLLPTILFQDVRPERELRNLLFFSLKLSKKIFRNKFSEIFFPILIPNNPYL